MHILQQIAAALRVGLGAEYRPRPVPGNDVLYGEGVERIAVPGVIVGSTRLYTGEQVPVIVPDHRGLANWTTDALLDAMHAVAGDDDDARGKIRRFLDRMFELTRNLGTAPRERALNYAATDALMLRGIITDPRYKKEFEGLDLDTIDVTKSPICRPEYDCWDVVVTFYNPDNLLQARRGLRFTKKLKVELLLQYQAPMEWKIKIQVYDREREDAERGKLEE